MDAEQQWNEAQEDWYNEVTRVHHKEILEELQYERKEYAKWVMEVEADLERERRAALRRATRKRRTPSHNTQQHK